MELLNGKVIAESIQERTKEKVAKAHRAPCLTVLLNTFDSSSVGYVETQKKLAASLGIELRVIEMDNVQENYVTTIQTLNADEAVDGILLTRPLPPLVHESEVIAQLDPYKDVDALNATALGKIAHGDTDWFAPATAEAIMEMLQYYHIPLIGKRVTIVGRSISVGRPVSLLLLNEHATITVCHTKTADLKKHLQEADIVIACVGKPHLLQGSDMKKEAVVIDAGIHYLVTGIVGDVVPHEHLKAISKVPGGIGPITSNLIMEHVVKCYERKYQR